MPELISLHLSIGKLSLSGSISWGNDDAAPAVIGPCEPVDVPDLDDCDPELLRERLGFRS